MQVNRCVKCMRNLEAYPCPHCGFNASQEQQPLFALPWNTVLHGRYLMGKVLGQGGFGITYVGWDLVLDIKVAIKEYYPSGMATRKVGETRVLWNTGSGTSQGGDRDSFLTEARRMAKISGIPEIVRVLDTFTENDTAYIVMEFVEGITLKDRMMREGPMRFNDCVDLLVPLMTGLDKVHQQGLIHRDISPDNIMQQTDGSARLLDFGAAKDLSAQRGDGSQMVAKQGFSPVEQYLANGSIGPWTDVYALCATIYYMLTGDMLPDALDRLDHPVIEFSKAKVQPLTRKQREVLTAGLAVQDKDRIRSIAALIEQLKAAKDKPKSRKGLIIGAVAGGLAGVAVVAMLLMRPAPAPLEAVRVVELGATNGNCNSFAMRAQVQEQYTYYVDKNLALYMSTYDESSSSFHIGTKNRDPLDDRVFYINVSGDAVYFIHDGDVDDTLPDSICRMERDGSGLKALFGGEQYWRLQYARLSNDAEYLYYLRDDEETDDGLHELYRYDIAEGVTEQLLPEKVSWYNLDGEYLYYVTYEDRRRGTQWRRAKLDGTGSELLNDSDALINGFIEDGTAFMYSRSREVLMQFDLEGNEIREPLAIYYGCGTYGDGWLYYSLSGTGEVHRVLPDGASDTVILRGSDVAAINYCGGWLWIIEQEEINGENVVVQSRMLYKDGSEVVEIDERTKAGVGGLTTGVTYEFDGTTLVLTGYSGEEDHIIVPWEVAGTKVDRIRTSAAFPAKVAVYTYPRPEELRWQAREDGTGVDLVEYVPGTTKDYPYRVLPAFIDGQPVISLGESLFEGEETLEGVILLGSVQRIEEAAFKDCKALAHVELPATLRYIGESAFEDTDALTGIELPEGLEEIDFNAFRYGGLESIHIPSTVTGLYGNPFGTTTMTTFTVAKENTVYAVQDGAIYSRDSLKAAPATVSGSFTVRGGTKYIAQEAFMFSRYDTVTIPGSVRSIYRMAFAGSDVRVLNLEEGLEEIGVASFILCNSLTEVTIPRSVKTISSNAFSKCDRLTTVTLSRNCEVAEDAFGAGVELHYYEDEGG